MRNHVQHVLELNRGNKLRAGRQLSISRATLYRILVIESLLTCQPLKNKMASRGISARGQVRIGV